MKVLNQILLYFQILKTEDNEVNFNAMFNFDARYAN
jgi:hypothetical protein